MDNFDLRKYLAEGKLLKEDYNLPDSDSTTDQYVNNHWDGILKDILRAHTDLRNSKGGESIPEKPSQLDIDIVLGRFDGADEFMDVDPNVYDEYFDFYDMYLVTQRDEENTKSISDEDYPKGNYDGYTKRDDLPKLSEGKLLKEDSEDIAEMAYERDSVEDIVKRIKPILSNHPQLKKQEDPEQYLIDFVTKRKRFINKNEAPIGKDKFARNIGTMPYDKYIKLQFNEYIYSTTP
jgi:hypothetical protein